MQLYMVLKDHGNKQIYFRRFVNVYMYTSVYHFFQTCSCTLGLKDHENKQIIYFRRGD